MVIAIKYQNNNNVETGSGQTGLYASKNELNLNKKTVLSQGNRAMPQLFFSV